MARFIVWINSFNLAVEADSSEEILLNISEKIKCVTKPGHMKSLVELFGMTVRTEDFYDSGQLYFKNIKIIPLDVWFEDNKVIDI